MKWGLGLLAGIAASMTAVLGLTPSHAVSTPVPASAPTGAITVSAAASLTDVFPVIANAFMKKNPGTSVQFNFAGSSTLVQQIIAGAPVDVLATASEPTMSTAVAAGRVRAPLLFAKNRLAIALPPGNPAKITGLSSLSRDGVLVAQCVVSVPCGAATRNLLARNGVTVKPVTLELDVRSVLGKVMSGEVDAGIVFVTDVRSAGSKVASIALANNVNVTTTYPIALVKGAANPTTAQAFVNYVAFTPSAQGILRAYGFAKPR